MSLHTKLAKRIVSGYIPSVSEVDEALDDLFALFQTVNDGNHNILISKIQENWNTIANCKAEFDEMPFDRLIDWVDDDGIERERWIHATGTAQFENGICSAIYIYPDGNIC